MNRSLDTDTLCAHAGQPRSPGAPASHVSAIHHQTVFDFPSIEASIPALTGNGYVYRRNGTPNADELASAVAMLEGAERGLATGSGMGAIAAAVLSVIGAGERVVVQRDAYGGSHALFGVDLARLGVEVVFADAYDIDAFAAAVSDARIALVETISNPLVREVDVSQLAKVCQQRGARLMVDNTFATPLRQRPLEQGADLVVHSATKFLGGHHDACAGVVVGDRDSVLRATEVAVRFGLVAPPLDAWLAVRGMRTLAVRMERAWQTAGELAGRLAADTRVAGCHHAERCAIVSFDVGSFDAANTLVEKLGLITLSPSLGGVTTTVSHAASSSHRALTDQQRADAGIGPGLLRLSIGLESAADVWRDLDQALG